MNNDPDYDCGLINDYGGGDVSWWQDYIRAEIGRANDHWSEITATKDALIDKLKLEAQIHAGEARCANSTIAEIYQAISGSTGEPGNWNGAEPVRAYIATKDAEIERLREALQELNDAVLDRLCNGGVPGFDPDRLDRAQTAASHTLEAKP